MSTPILRYSCRAQGVKKPLILYVRKGMVIAVEHGNKRVDFPPAKQEIFSSCNFKQVKLLA